MLSIIFLVRNKNRPSSWENCNVWVCNEIFLRLLWSFSQEKHMRWIWRGLQKTPPFNLMRRKKSTYLMWDFLTYVEISILAQTFLIKWAMHIYRYIINVFCMYFIYTKEPENIWEVSQAIKEQHVSKNIFLFVLKTQNTTIQDLKLFPNSHIMCPLLFFSVGKDI